MTKYVLFFLSSGLLQFSNHLQGGPLKIIDLVFGLSLSVMVIIECLKPGTFRVFVNK